MPLLHSCDTALFSYLGASPAQVPGPQPPSLRHGPRHHMEYGGWQNGWAPQHQCPSQLPLRLLLTLK